MEFNYRPGQVAELLGVSVDTVRRWADAGRLQSVRTEGGQRLIDGASLARLLAESAPPADGGPVVAQSARNRFPGVVTRVVKDGVMAQVEIHTGRTRVVSLMSREAADELGLTAGAWAVASVKSTNVVIELTTPPPAP